MKYDIERISAAIAEAIAYSQQFANVDDGGTCNFDSCYIPVPGLRESAADKIGNVFLSKSGWHGRILHLRGTSGQGNRRTTMAQAQRTYLQENYPELRPSMYYMMD